MQPPLVMANQGNIGQEGGSGLIENLRKIELLTQINKMKAANRQTEIISSNACLKSDSESITPKAQSISSILAHATQATSIEHNSVNNQSSMSCNLDQPSSLLR